MAVVASAPGKVLMTGEYLVLERPSAGIVLSTNARFYSVVKPIYDEVEPDSWAWEPLCRICGAICCGSSIFNARLIWEGCTYKTTPAR